MQWQVCIALLWRTLAIVEQHRTVHTMSIRRFFPVAAAVGVAAMLAAVPAVPSSYTAVALPLAVALVVLNVSRIWVALPFVAIAALAQSDVRLAAAAAAAVAVVAVQVRPRVGLAALAALAGAATTVDGNVTVAAVAGVVTAGAVLVADAASAPKLSRNTLFASAALFALTVFMWPVIGGADGVTTTAVAASLTVAFVVGLIATAIKTSSRVPTIAAVVGATVVVALSSIVAFPTVNAQAPATAAATPQPAVTYDGDLRDLERCVQTGGDTLMAVTCYATSLLADYRETNSLADTLGVVEQAFFSGGPLGRHFQNHCHESLHFLSRTIARETPGDKRQVIREGTDLCSAGFGHGIWEVIYADLTNDEFIAEIPTMCTGWDGEERTEEGSAGIGCRHILGHNLATRFRGEVATVAAMCKVRDPQVAAQSPDLSRSEVQHRTNCLAGLFMEDFLDLTRNRTEDIPPGQKLFEVCAVPELLEDEELGWGCYNEIGALLTPTVRYDPIAAIALCRTHADELDLHMELRTACYDSVARSVAPAIAYQVDEAIEACSRTNEEYLKGWCVRGLATAIMFNSNSRAFGDEVCAVVTGEHLESCMNRLDGLGDVLDLSVTAN